MARIVTGAFTTFNLSLHLDTQTLDLYGVANYFATPGYTGSSPYVYMGSATASAARMEVKTGTGAFNAINARFNDANAPIGFGVANNNGFAYLAHNTKQVSGTDGQTYDIASTATQLRMDGGRFRFNYAATGLAGAAITWAEVMSTDTSGNLLETLQATPPTLASNSQMVFNLTSNTNLRISVRGTDGVTRVANITLA